MRFLSYESVLITIGVLLHIVLCTVLFRKGLARLYPIFFIYLLSNIVMDPLSLALDPYSNGYRHYYFIATLLDYVLQLLIIFEIGLNVLRPAQRSLHLPLARIITVVLLASAIATASFILPLQTILSADMIQLSLRVSLGLAILKLLVFLALAGFAQILGISWKNHVLQLATGLAFFACVQVLVQMATSHIPQGSTNYLSHLDRLMRIPGIAYSATLVFWIWAFSRNEAPRKDFTPQMQEVLVTIAATARRTRIAVTRSTDRR